jgi:hypothetical protein
LYSSITGTSSITANGSSTSTVTIVLKDSSNIAIVGTVPTFSATNSNNGNSYGACSATDASGSATCSLSSTKAETKTLSIASPISLAGGSVTFTAGTPAGSTSQITGTSPATADGISASSVTVVLYDTYNNPVSGVVPTFSATNTGGSNSYGACSSSDATGASTCTLTATIAEVKTLSITTPVSKSGGSVSFSAGTPVASNSSISGSGPVSADGTTTSTVTITLNDQYGNPVSGQVPTFTATNSSGTNAYGTCSTSNASGISLCALTSAWAETKTLFVATPVSLSGGTVSFVQAVSSTYSTITGSGPVAATGTNTSSISITLKDYSNAAIVGVVPTFSATDTNSTNIYTACSASSGLGVSTCTLKSLQAETKILTLTSPANFDGGSVVFTQKASLTYSSIVGTGPVQTSGTHYSDITITLHDYMNVGIAGVVPTFSATNSGTSNVYSACSSTDANGVSTCTLDSNNAQTKTLKITAPITLSGGTVLFN